MLYATIMAGGAGTRFWPASRRDRPKQLLSLAGPRSMLQATVDRLAGLCAAEQILILTNERLVEATRAQLPQLRPDAILGEPCKRDTAPCIGLAAGLIVRSDPGATMLVMPADHVIHQADQFQQAVRQAEQLLQEDPSRIITFGIPPRYPAQVFGYIQRGAAIADSTVEASSFHVKQFCEKPDLETARLFLQSGDYYWNAGIFLWRAQTILDSLQQFEPAMHGHLKHIADSAGTPAFAETLRSEFAAIEGKSIDYAVMEKYHNVCMMPAPFDWDDVGNWTAIPRISGVDDHNNSVSGKHLGINTSDCIVHSTGDHLVVTLGMNDCIVVHTPDATLIADKTDESAIRQVVAKLEQLGWNEYL